MHQLWLPVAVLTVFLQNLTHTYWSILSNITKATRNKNSEPRKTQAKARGVNTPTHGVACQTEHVNRSSIRAQCCLREIWIPCRSRDSSVGIAKGWTARVRFPAVQDFSLLPSVQTGSGAHPASYPMGTGGSFPGGKAGTWSWPLASI
jgi:hypothetical protein